MELIGPRAILFTDIEGSTALFKRLGAKYGDVLDTHHRILRNAIKSSGGSEVVSEGDSFVAIFDDVESAVDASILAQLGLHRESWPSDNSVRVRMGIHTGELAKSDSGLIGMALHETARISAAAHGGQILVSESVAASLTAAGSSSTEIDLRNLGRFELKDVGAVALIQLMHPELDTGFPPPRASELGRNNLPAHLDEFIGRANEVAEVRQLATERRLVTLVGAGGVGKTRIALAVASDLLPNFPDGVWLAELAEFAAGDDIISAVGAAIGGADAGLTLDQLADHCGQHRSLIVLDNCEHVLASASEVVTTLTTQCPQLRVLATSQEPLGLAGEVVWRVPSMPTDEASTLFQQRLNEVRHEHGLDVDVALVGQICERLDGIPLAIELAAARCRTMSLGEVDKRLADRFRLLRVGGSGTRARHQTLLATVDWSFGLLDQGEQAAAARFSVFRGGADLDAIESVCIDPQDPTGDLFDLVDVLNAKSIVHVDIAAHQSRVRLPETIRQYAAERLKESGEAELIAERHARYFAEFAASAERGWRSPESALWVRRCSVEAENLAVASDWLEQFDPDAAALMLCDLRIWLTAEDGPLFLRKVARLSERSDLSAASRSDVAALRALLGEGYGREGADVAATSALRALASLDAVTDPYRRLRVMAHVAVGLHGHDLELAIDISEQALNEARRLDDPGAMAAAMYDLILLRPEDDPATRELRRELIDSLDEQSAGVWGVGLFVDEALDAHHHGRHAQSIELLERAERMVDFDSTRALDSEIVAFTVWSSLIRAEQGDHAEAVLLSDHTLARLDDTSVHLRKVLHSTRGHALLLAGRTDEARQSFETAIDRADGWRYLVHAIAVVGITTLDADAGEYDSQRLSYLIDDPTRQGWLRARTHDLLARMALADGRHDDARTHINAADELHRAGEYVVPPALLPAHTELRECANAAIDSANGGQ